MTKPSHGAPLLACGISFLLGVGVMLAQQPSQGATRREPQLENAQVKVWKSIIMPNQPLTMHRHEHARVLIALTDGELKVVGPDGTQLDRYHWKSGQSYWLSADPPGRMHGDVNESGRPIEVIVVELQKDK